MPEPLDSLEAIHHAARSIRALLAARGEWLYARSPGGTTRAVRRSEIDVRVAHGQLIFSCWNDAGARVWRIGAWEWTGEKLLLEAKRRAGAERATLELIPRSLVRDALDLIGETRHTRCCVLAQMACALWPGAKIIRAGLSAGARRGQPGRNARILIRRRNEIIAVTGSVAPDETQDTDALLSSALIWLARLGERASVPPVRRLCLVAGARQVDSLLERLALLRAEVRSIISVYEIDENWETLTPAVSVEPAQLWSESPPRLRRSFLSGASQEAASIVSLAPEAIDIVRARHGETLRFHGLAFARVRRLMNVARIWFGVEGARRRRLLDESTEAEWFDLIAELAQHRTARAADRQHWLYRAAPEAWLESILRRDITRLDPGLRLAPLHAQFRTTQAKGRGGGARPVDLLALRRDGRLAVIELKVTEDREHVLQGTDYWRRVEAHRRCGNITRARLFGDAHIEDAPPLVYLVAPLLRHHRAFQTLSRAVSPEIELYRFDLNEDWRAGVRTMRRTCIN